MIEPPNELELSRAFTRKMNHLLSMMKVIHKFKMLLTKTKSKRDKGPESSSVSPQPATTTEDAAVSESAERARPEDIESILAGRRHLLSQQDEHGDKGHAHEVGDQAPLFLGIGTGARNAFAQAGDGQATPNIVADSPTAVDYNVYDRAYEEAIKRHMDAKPSKRPTIYLTKFVKETSYFKKMENLIEGTVFSPPTLKADVSETAHALKNSLKSPFEGSHASSSAC